MLDDIDKRILRTLQRDGRLQNVELAKKIGLSPSPCLRLSPARGLDFLTCTWGLRPRLYADTRFAG